MKRLMLMLVSGAMAMSVNAGSDDAMMTVAAEEIKDEFLVCAAASSIAADEARDAGIDKADIEEFEDFKRAFLRAATKWVKASSTALGEQLIPSEYEVAKARLNIKIKGQGGIAEGDLIPRIMEGCDEIMPDIGRTRFMELLDSYGVSEEAKARARADLGM